MPLTDEQVLTEWDWLGTHVQRGARLHHADLTAEDAQELGDCGYLESVLLTCGRLARTAHIPGVFSRMGAMRCAHCCDKLGYPRGKGSPKNDNACRSLVEARLQMSSRSTLPRVPNQPKTPLRSFRIPDDLYKAAQAKAAERDESVSDVVRKALERYVKRK